MYWPIGVPNVYALSQIAQATYPSRLSNDGLGGDNDEESGGDVEASSGSLASRSDIESSELKNGSSNGLKSQTHSDDLGRVSEIVAAKVSRSANLFATVTTSSLTVWQTKPVIALASITRSAHSLNSYGPNVALHFRPDALILVVQTSLGYFITYALSSDPSVRVFATQLPPSSRHARTDSAGSYATFRRANQVNGDSRPGEADGIKEVALRFRMVIRIDAGISRALALDDELAVATQKPAAVQSIRWTAEGKTTRTVTELISKMPWVSGRSKIVEMVHDTPMNLDCWVTSDGRAYAVQRRSEIKTEGTDSRSLYQGFCFREPKGDADNAITAAINARFSLIAVGNASGTVDVFTVKDYTGNIPLSHKHQLAVSSDTHGRLTHLSYSPDGYCLLVGYERGWAMWSVYGKLGANSFGADRSISCRNEETWLTSIKDAFWIEGGAELALLGMNDDRLWVLDLARSALTSCFGAANIARGLLHSGNSFILCNNYENADLMAQPTDASLLQSVQVPATYLASNWPIRCAVASADGRYVAVAGRRGLAHYSLVSGRWKMFEDPALEAEFSVRGGMCWHNNMLIASVQAGNRYQLRLYARDRALDSRGQSVEDLPSPAISTTASGADSVLIYTHDNTLLHYIVLSTGKSVKMVQVGQIGFHGVIRAPSRVRSISWILPEDQLDNGDPSQDVATASVLLLVDGKLVFLQPSINEHGELKYDMRVIAHNVEYYLLVREQEELHALTGTTSATFTMPIDVPLGHSLRDSLWFFDGDTLNSWPDIQDVMACAPVDLGRDLPSAVRIPIDFYPLSAVISKGTVNGVEAEISQRRDLDFSSFRHGPRTQLFLPQLLREHLAEYNSPAALHLSQSYSHLPYFPHALEVLLHNVLDSEVDNPPSLPEAALLPTVISFLSSFPSFLDVVVNCTRKTELRSWQTLFSYLPPVTELFEQSLAQEKLKTAAGYLLVLHTFEQDEFQIEEFARLLTRASQQQDWELCSEVARFLVGIDDSGRTLRAALTTAGLSKADERSGSLGETLNRNLSSAQNRALKTNGADLLQNKPVLRPGNLAQDYFTLERPGQRSPEQDFMTPDP